ncbi:MAG: NYN domain-containing protein [Candidatus Thorarchaeota archaeon]
MADSVAVFWDIENCPPPRGMSGMMIEKQLRESLSIFGPIRQIHAYAELAKFPTNLRTELQRSGIHLIDTPHGSSGKDAADKMIITDMFILAMDSQKELTYVLIAGDIDYSYPLAKLKQRRHQVVLVVPPVGANPILKERADKILEWTAIMAVRNATAQDESLRFETLLSALGELSQKGQTLPSLTELESYLDAKYPTWRETSGYKSIKQYVSDAEEGGWVGTTMQEKEIRVFIVEDEEEEKEDVEKSVEEDRFGPLVTVLEEARMEGKNEVELANLGIKLRSLLIDPLERLGVKKLKDYVLEAEKQGVVKVRQDGLQYYVSLAGPEQHGPSGRDEVDAILDLMEKALNELRAEEIMPTARTLIGRMRELVPGWNLYDSAVGDIPALLKAAKERREMTVERYGNQYLVFPKSGRFKYHDPNDDSDPFSTDQWKVLARYLVENRTITARGRYGFAKRLKNSVPGISKMSMGALIHMVQLAVKRGWLEFRGTTVGVHPMLDRQVPEEELSPESPK